MSLGEMSFWETLLGEMLFGETLLGELPWYLFYMEKASLVNGPGLSAEVFCH
jgi:hypothetical protein